MWGGDRRVKWDGIKRQELAEENLAAPEKTLKCHLGSDSNDGPHLHIFKYEPLKLIGVFG